MDILSVAGLWRRKWTGKDAEISVSDTNDGNYLPSWAPEYRSELAQNQFLEWHASWKASIRVEAPPLRDVKAQVEFDHSNPYRIFLQGLSLFRIGEIQEWAILPGTNCNLRMVCDVVERLRREMMKRIEDYAALAGRSPSADDAARLGSLLCEAIVAGGCTMDDNNEARYADIRAEAFELFTLKCLNQDLVQFENIMLGPQDDEVEYNKFESCISQIDLDQFPKLKAGLEFLSTARIARPTYILPNGKVNASGDASLSAARFAAVMGRPRNLVPVLWRYINSIASIFQKLSLFLSEDEQVRIAPRGTRNDDTVVILDGCQLPFVLRQIVRTSRPEPKERETSFQNWAIIGPCFINNLTNAAQLDVFVEASTKEGQKKARFAII